ncbi:hypothetical protein C8J57DRAFT_627072 [Mycena rebaudengoi]|nr:hypothetical protein C8J57DRAFT_627072 [Mycena rebaudengoi]
MHCDSPGVVRRRQTSSCIRRMYSAQVEGRTSNMTVAVYQGQNAQSLWRQSIENYISFRHPNFFQLYGIVGTSGLHATIFHDDLIPVDALYSRYKDSPISATYLTAYTSMEFQV